MSIRLFHVSDLHFGREDRDAMARFAEVVGAERPDAVICTGDLTMRARRREFAAACEWLQTLGVPVTIEPGNHDLPHFHPLLRLLDPYKRYARVEAAIERPLVLPGVLLVPLKTTARLQLRALQRGRVSPSGLAGALAMLREKPEGVLGIVTCHHPLIGADGESDTAGGMKALRQLAAAGAAAVLSGHVHDPFDFGWLAGERSIRLVGAGTLSQRVRATAPSFNEVRCAGGTLDVVPRLLS